jgi:YfiH family protein
VLPVELGPGVRAAFTGRGDGNLALTVGSDPAATREHRRLIEGWLGAPVVFGRQVHGTVTRFVAANQPDAAWVLSASVTQTVLNPTTLDPTTASALHGVDALVTDSSAVALGVLVADCVPVLLADPQAGLVATAHAGRVGLLGGVLDSVLTAMCERGADPHRIRAVLGPAAGPCCYEVPAEMARDATESLPQLSATTTWGTPSLDLRAGCRAVLSRAGVAGVDEFGGCTIEDRNLFSHRASGGFVPPTRGQGREHPARPVGRFAGVIRLLG